jgi:protein-S-isoprenylcysteine O-methyltransferase Ste14
MAALALALLVLYASLAFGARVLVQLRRTGSTGFKGVSGRPGSPEWLGGVLFVAAIVLLLVAPVLAIMGRLQPFAAIEGPAGYALGLVLYAFGLAGTLVAQGAMGSSWRVGVDASEKTELVTAGPFAVVRNPIFAAMIPAVLGLALLVPNIAALVGFLSLVAAVELQVRFVEEPYLLRTHGRDYAAYASRVGRFVPGLGRLQAGRVRQNA